MSADERMLDDQRETPDRTIGDARFSGDHPDTRDDRGQENVAVMEADEVQDLRDRWIAIQSAFIDEPRRSVAEADRLVGDVTDRIVRSFEDERARLEEVWESGEDITTEDLRLTLQRYRAFFDRLLAI